MGYGGKVVEQVAARRLRASGMTMPDIATELDAARYDAMFERVERAYPNLRVLAATLRSVRSASVNDWGAVAWSPASAVARQTGAPGAKPEVTWTS